MTENSIKPMVSVIIPTYKRSNMLPRAIASVLSQTYSNIQVVVVDDNNPDTEYRKNTEALMAQYASDERIKYVKHSKNANGSVARNTGIKSSDGEIVAFLDDDDFFYPEKIEKQMAYLLQHPQFRAVYCGWDRDGEVVIPYDEGDLSYNILSGDHIILTNVIMMWKEDALACGGWDETFMRHQEAAFLLRYFRNGGTIGVVPEVLVEFDVSDRSNEAGNPHKHEEQTLHYLNSYQDMIERCAREKKNADKMIWSHRYRGIFLGYLRARDLKGAFSFWFRYCIKIPFRFSIVLIDYIIERTIRRKKI
ncbi:glycosyltransferase family 2 protein [Ruminococcus sp. CLA-AA-H200]|uniref:Glycosyltransferase family 2 protein n=1 Tax=Ruminococcus turbiniformis TaxID=2881258 RepID=A0ABS8G1G1_9FIRM|nr:glycosyltransferase family A protein [Ruminococcus turbiniformis]MCC2256056.1 glycosyltransferase family 2 protein [Ruminococcus turbiniformis]